MLPKSKMLDLFPHILFMPKIYLMSGRYKRRMNLNLLKFNRKRFQQRKYKNYRGQPKFKMLKPNMKKTAIVQANKEKQLYLLAVMACLASVDYFYNFYQKKRPDKKMQLLAQVQDEKKKRLSRDLHDNMVLKWHC